MAITYEGLMETISNVAKAERITKAGLSTLSRDLLQYMIEDDNADVRPINALLGQGEDGKFILTPINWRIAVQYFHHFVAFTSNYDEVKEYAVQGTGERVALTFNKKSKKRWDKTVELVNAWLEDANNDLWAWSGNVKMDGKPKDYAKEITKAVKAGLAEDKGNLGLDEILAAVCEAEGLTVGMLMDAMAQANMAEAA